MEGYNREREKRWLALATGGIRFGPDRRAVSEELAAHLEDKTADLQRIFPDMTESEVWDRTLKEMGDPRALGKELAKIHRPWLGYLWRASQVVLAAALLVLVLVGINVIGGSSTLGGVVWPGEQPERQSGRDYPAGGGRRNRGAGGLYPVPGWGGPLVRSSWGTEHGALSAGGNSALLGKGRMSV